MYMATKKTTKKAEVSKSVKSKQEEVSNTAEKVGFPIKLIGTNFIVIDRYGINKSVKLSKEKLLSMKVGDLYYE